MNFLINVVLYHPFEAIVFNKITVLLKIKPLTLSISELSRSSPLSWYKAKPFAFLAFVSFTFISTLARTFLDVRLPQSEGLLLSGGFLFSLGILVLLGIKVFLPVQMYGKLSDSIQNKNLIKYYINPWFYHSQTKMLPYHITYDRETTIYNNAIL